MNERNPKPQPIRDHPSKKIHRRASLEQQADMSYEQPLKKDDERPRSKANSSIDYSKSPYDLLL